MLATSLSAADYAWVKAKDDYGWGYTAYVLNLAAFHGRVLVFNRKLWTLGGHYEEGKRLRNDVWSSDAGKNWQQLPLPLDGHPGEGTRPLRTRGRCGYSVAMRSMMSGHRRTVCVGPE